ncbi:hypothetical protein C6497_00735 [Candidatus Poribacteria bacterium]|nr:MAG: hypothetical protein C6497_00735 [Candidatus Poribacteria bacterium]
MKTQDTLNRINALMSRFVVEVKGASAMNMLDINSISEDMLIPLFSVIFGYTDLNNLNRTEQVNFPAIDLGDKKTKTAYQITSDPRSQKIKDTLTQFVKSELYKEYDRLMIYILTEKQKSYRVKFDCIIQDKFSFNIDNDILDYNDLLKEISGFPLAKLREIEKLLEDNFGENIHNTPKDIMDWIDYANKTSGSNQGTSKINIQREKLRTDLFHFVSQGNGLVIGSPGVGKTHLLKELHNHLQSQDIPHLLLSIDLLGNSDTNEWSDGLSFRGDLIEGLKSVPVSDNKAILLFDGFDAARDERKRKNFLILIKRAIQELENWTVVVTVRTYDAMKSQELLDLFGNSDDTEYQSKDISCRHFTIPSFTEDEILQALVQIGCPNSIYDNGSDEFKEKVLTNPFNLWLLEKILMNLSDEDLNSLSQIRSEAQLFDLFWQRRIVSADNEFDRLSVLDGIAREMVKQCSLSIRQINIGKSLNQTALDDLLSDEILARVSSTGQRIAFSHNILFDYAISVLLIDDDEPKQLEEFITEDPSRPIFLRPSLTYFFTRLWYYEDARYFWRVFWHILQSEQSVHLRLVARLIPTSVIANEAREIEQLKPLIQELQNREPIAEEAITRLFQALQTLQIKREKPWIDFCEQVSEYLNVDFAWDLANLTTDILEKTTDPDVIDTCGRIGRRLLEWVWQERESKTDDWYNRFGGRWAVPLVAKTYHTNIEESYALLQKVLQLTSEENFPIGFLSWLTDNVDSIFRHDPEFAISIYFTTFSHQFDSEGETRRGGQILPITTYRSQDFGMCQYRLVKHFPQFLQEKPIYATRAAIRCLNYIIAKEHILRFSREDMTIEELNNPFDFNGKTANFVQDYSHIWDSRSSTDEPIEMVDFLFEYISELAADIEKHALLDNLLEEFIDHVIAAFFWKRLLKTGSQFPNVFAPRLFELCLAKPVLQHHEVTYEYGLFLKNAAYEFTPKQLRQIEENLVGLPLETTDENLVRHLEDQRNLFLAQIPPDLLSTSEGKQIRENMDRENNLPENRSPDSPIIHSETVTEEKWLREKGVDTTTPENKKLKDFSDSLEDFITEWRNREPTQEDAGLILPKLREVHKNLKGKINTDDELVNILWRKLTESAAILGRLSVNLDEDSLELCRSILLEGASHKLPDPAKEKDDTFDSPGYSSQPRHYAVEGLLRIFFYKHDLELLYIIEKLADDKVPSVRMITAMYLPNIYKKEPNRFWAIINRRAEIESNLIVQECLYSALTHVLQPTTDNDENTVQVMSKILKKTPLPQQKMGTYDPFSFLIIGLAIVRQNHWALSTIDEEYLNDPVKYANLLTRFVEKIIKGYIDPRRAKDTDFQDNLIRAISLLNSIVTAIIPAMNALGSTFKEQRTEKVEQELRNTYSVLDQIITSLYFTFPHKDNNDTKPAEENEDKDIHCLIFNEVYPLMQQIVDFANDSENGLMFAPTAHHFIKLLTNFLNFDPKKVIILAGDVATSSERFGYNLEPLAVEDVVKLVEIVLADHRDLVRDDEDCLESLLNLLDLFAKTGWSEALNLVWRLDEVFR